MKKIIRTFIFSIILIFVASFSFLTYQGYLLYKNAIEEVSISEKIDEIHKNTIEYTKYEMLPKDYVNAVVAVEDRRFFEHNGIDLISIARAIGKDISTLSLAEGGSTITQQLAKNTYFTQKKEFTRKIAEIFMAFEYEKECSKEEIFELYVNTMYFGDGYYSIADATQGYFNKNVDEMNLYECTLLAGIPNAPSVYAPTENPELAKQRQAQVLKKMVKYQFLTDKEASSILDNNSN